MCNIKNTISSLLSKYNLDEGRRVSWVSSDSICILNTSGFDGDYTETIKFSDSGNISISLDNVREGGTTTSEYNVNFLSTLSKIYKIRGSFKNV